MLEIENSDILKTYEHLHKRVKDMIERYNDEEYKSFVKHIVFLLRLGCRQGVLESEILSLVKVDDLNRIFIMIEALHSNLSRSNPDQKPGKICQLWSLIILAYWALKRELRDRFKETYLDYIEEHLIEERKLVEEEQRRKEEEDKRKEERFIAQWRAQGVRTSLRHLY